MVLLPPWIVSHWTVAQLGLVGNVLPRTLFFHSTNANKELALKANGYWHFAANLARDEHDKQPEAAIFGPRAERPRVIAYAPHVHAASSHQTATRAADDPLGTPDEQTHAAEVLTPLLLAAAASGRVAALPHLECAALPWASKAWATSSAKLAATAPYAFGSCRTGACSFRVVASGVASEALQREDATLASELGYAAPFASPDADAALIASAPLSCVPMNGANVVSAGGGSVRALDAPVWSHYARLLAASAHGAHGRARSDAADGHVAAADHTTMPAGRTVDVGHSTTGKASVGSMSYAQLERAMAAVADDTIAYLPRSRLRVREVPPAARRACGDCTMASDEYDVPGTSSEEGYCEETRTGDGGDCEAGSKGSWRLGEAGMADVRSCLRRCVLTCARCAFVSVSVPERDCSWYAPKACNVARLANAGLGHRTFIINDALRAAVLANASTDRAEPQTGTATPATRHGRRHARSGRGRWRASARRKVSTD
jgi:hypothetical protein